ncbi:regulator of chromosome condensation 1/beta-lactamase-inhibitor protein II [Cantharellus anzutake]|uniref:regulator of chromosome condensation 1/beta-lactamase-inhibitor protein II n=1 Tax=Cantharellus anzutake TaxID=1750568 RepID=UPI001905FA3F|nr:regulator of chromosome condensation 1/beta-lactamase-inhibitor protein II [Cantharellus anzutake]KAF8342950.1 regulator of chromosome condensation 1/beta-lactamase-inhibitor protein II [Cantharellus anzutake]
MPPKRAAASATKPVESRPSRKRPADEPSQSQSKRPRRAVTSTILPKATTKTNENRKPAPTKVAARSSVKKETKPKTATTIKKTAATSAATRSKASKAPKPAGRAPSKPEPTKKKVVPRPTRVKPPPFNPLTAIPRTRATAPLHAFVFGTGGDGQFGLGTDVTGEIPRPRLHTWAEECINKGKFSVKGDQKAGLETLVAGGMHSLAIDPRGRVWSWGVNDEGALGRKVDDVLNPERPGEVFERAELEANPGLVQGLLADFRAVAVSAGDNVSLAIGSDGHLKAWGSFHSSNGSLGFHSASGAPKRQMTPVAIPQLEKIQLSSIAAGTNHVVGLTTDGRVYTWGVSEQGRLGRRVLERRLINSTRPDPLHLRKIVGIGSGSYHSFAVDSDGDVFAWGLNQYGQLGLEPEVDASGKKQTVVWTPTLVPELSPSELSQGGWNDSRVVQISGGEHHTIFLLNDGRVFATGRIDSSQLGLHSDHPAVKKAKESNLDYISTPTRVLFPPEPKDGEPNPEVDPKDEKEENQRNVVKNSIVKISAAGDVTLALSKEGHAYSWGYGASGQLGLGADTEEQRTPSRVRWKETDKWFVEDISIGGQHGFILACERALRAKQLEESQEEGGASQITAVEEVKLNGVNPKTVSAVVNDQPQGDDVMGESE